MLKDELIERLEDSEREVRRLQDVNKSLEIQKSSLTISLKNLKEELDKENEYKSKFEKLLKINDKQEIRIDSLIKVLDKIS